MEAALPHPLGQRIVDNETAYKANPFKVLLNAVLLIIAVLIAQTPAIAQVNGLGQRPYLGWSTAEQARQVDAYRDQVALTRKFDTIGERSGGRLGRA